MDPAAAAFFFMCVNKRMCVNRALETDKKSDKHNREDEWVYVCVFVGSIHNKYVYVHYWECQDKDYNSSRVSVCIVHAGGRKAKLTKGAWNLYCEWPQLLILN